jgi:hypothetical protein
MDLTYVPQDLVFDMPLDREYARSGTHKVLKFTMLVNNMFSSRLLWSSVGLSLTLLQGPWSLPL